MMWSFIRPTIVGVLVAGGTLKKLQQQKEPKFTIRELVNANREAKTTLYFFTLKDVDQKKKKIHGTYFHEHEKMWAMKPFSFPDVLYSRLRSIEGKEGQYIRRFLQEHGVKLLNAKSKFDKWEVHCRLLKNKDMAPHLPVTKAFHEPDDLKEMFMYTAKVYVKPRSGRRGNHIMRIIHQPEGGYQYSYFTQKLVVGNEENFGGLIERINACFHGKKAIVQEAIDGLTIDQNIVDMRAEIQRNHRGELEVVGIFARVGIAHSPVTNLPSGAQFYRFDDFVQHQLHYSTEKSAALKSEIKQFVIKAHKSIENIYGPMGETAIDFVLDQKLHLWFIECNAASTKLAFPVTNADEQTIHRAFLNPLEYAKYLTRF